jgi:uncharacterized protein
MRLIYDHSLHVAQRALMDRRFLFLGSDRPPMRKATRAESSSDSAIASRQILRTGSLAVAVAIALTGGAAACSKKASKEEAVGSSTAYVSTAGQGLVISQVYGGTGDPRALYNRDYVELFNRSNAPIPLAGLSIHYAGSIGEFVNAGKLPAAAIVPPGGYYLVGFGAGEFGADLRVDGAGNVAVNILPANGKVALVRDVPVNDPNTADAATQLLGCGSVDAGRCSPNERVVDLVGYGVSSDHEGNAPTEAPSVSKALLRKGNGCVDTRNSANDFELGAPAPRSSETRAAVCANAVAPEQTTNQP